MLEKLSSSLRILRAAAAPHPLAGGEGRQDAAAPPVSSVGLAILPRPITWLSSRENNLALIT